jgi:ABC-type oligopeptide transport system ATPase subunit
MSIVAVNNLVKEFPNSSGSSVGKSRVTRAVNGISFSIRKGEIFGIVGESGSGKTTLGKLIVGLEKPTSGEILYNGAPFGSLRGEEYKAWRRKLQMVFQNPFTSFNPSHSIGRSLTEVGVVHKLGKEETEKRIKVLLDQISLTADVLNRKPKELSGGQLQRIAIARALILKPEFIVADEPVSALDVSVQAQVLNLLSDLKDEYGLTILFISHDLTVVEHVSGQIAVVNGGEIVESGHVQNIFDNPQHPYTKQLLAARPKMKQLERGTQDSIDWVV